MKKSKKLISLVVAAVMALGIVLAPMAAVAKNAPTVGKKNIGVFRITSPKAKTIRLVGTTDALGKKANNKGKKAKSITIVAKYQLDKTFYPSARKGTYTVTRICQNAFNKTAATKVILPATVKKIDAGAFKGAKAKTIAIRAKLSPAKATNMLKGTKASGKITIKVPKAKVTAWEKAAKAGKLGIKGSRIVIKKI